MESISKNKKQGELVKQGEVIVEFDLEAIKNENFSTETPVVITNLDNNKNILVTKNGLINYQDELMSIQLIQENETEGISGDSSTKDGGSFA